MLTRKQVILSAAQKCELCERERNPGLSNVELAEQCKVGKSIVIDILKEKNVGL